MGRSGHMAPDLPSRSICRVIRLLRSRLAAVVAGALVLVGLGYGVAVATGAGQHSVGVCVTKRNVVVGASRDLQWR